MPTIPQYLSQRTAGEVGGGAYINPNAAAPVYEGLRQVAGGIDNAVEAYLKHRDETELALSYNELNKFHAIGTQVVGKAKLVEAEAAVETENRPGISSIVRDDLEKVRREIINNYTGSRKNKLLLDQALSKKLESFYDEAFTHQINQQKVLNARSLRASELTLTEQVERGDLTFEQASKQINNQIDALYEGDLTTLKDEYLSKFKNASIKGYYNVVYHEATAQKTKEEARDVIEKAKLTANEQGSMIRNVDVYFESQEARQKAAEEQLRKEATVSGLEAFGARTLTPEIVGQIINTPGTDENDIKFWFGKLEEQNKAILSDNNLPYTTNDGKTLADLFVQISDPNAKAITSNQITEMIGRGLSVQTSGNLLKLADVTQTDVFKNTEVSIKGIFGYEGLLTGFGNKTLGGIYYNNAITEILNTLAETPLKGKELRDKMYEVAEPYMLEYWGSINESPNTIKQKMEAMGLKYSPSNNIIKPAVNPPKEGEVKERMPNESISDYNKRLGL